MKKALCVFLVLLMLLPLAACDPALHLFTVADNVTLHFQGTIVLSSGDFTDFSAESAENSGVYEIVFSLTPQGKRALVDATTKAAYSGGKLSLWAGEELLLTSTVDDSINSGRFVIYLTDKERLIQVCDKLRGNPIF